MTFNFEGFDPANTTPVPDVFFDVLLPHLNEAQLKVMLYIIRRTLGFKKTEDAISLKQFRYGIVTREKKQLDNGCGLKNFTTISKALKSLEQMNCVEKVPSKTDAGDDATTVYRIKFRGTTRNVVPTTDNVVRDYANRSTGTAPDGVGVLRETESQLNSNTRNSLQETVRQESIVTSASAESDAPANVYHFEAEKKKRTDPRIPVVASHSQVDIGNEETVKMKAVKIGDTNARKLSGRPTMPIPDLSRNEGRVDASHGEETDAAQRRMLESQQTPGAGSPPAATPPGGSTAASVQASRPSSRVDAAQRTASSPGTPSGAVQASGLPPMALTAKEIEKQLAQRQDEILTLYASKIGRKPSRSKANLDGALKLAQDDATDEDIGTTIDAILADSFLAKNLSLTFVHSKLDALARKPIPIENKQNGKAPTFVIDEERNRRNIEAMKARNAARRLAANG